MLPKELSRDFSCHSLIKKVAAFWLCPKSFVFKSFHGHGASPRNENHHKDNKKVTITYLSTCTKKAHDFYIFFSTVVILQLSHEKEAVGQVFYYQCSCLNA